MSKSNIAATVQRMKIEIMEDVDSGRVPASVSTFSQLHDYVDANEYGGFCEDKYSDLLIAEFGGRDEHQGMPQGTLEFIEVAQEHIDKWLANNGIASFSRPASSVSSPKKVGPKKPSHTVAPWTSSAAMSSDMYNIRHISGPNSQPIATIRHDAGMSQEEALANARLVKGSPDLLATMIVIADMLASHPEATKGNSKIHFAMHKALTSIGQAI